MNLEDLIFKPFEIGCPQCWNRTAVSFESLRLNEEINCSQCENNFFPDRNIDALLKLIKTVESPDVQRIITEDE